MDGAAWHRFFLDLPSKKQVLPQRKPLRQRAMDYNNTVIRYANYSYHNRLWADKGPEACSRVHTAFP